MNRVGDWRTLPRQRNGGGEQGRLLRVLRARHGKTQADIASALGVNRTTYAEWEGGESIPAHRLEDLRRLFPDDALPVRPCVKTSRVEGSDNA